MPNLTVRKINTLKQAGMYGDGGGLYLRIGPTGAKSWILRTMVHGKRRELGLGSASLIPLAEARETARSLRKIARAGGDPDTLRKRTSLTFEQATMRVYKNLLPTWKSKGHAKRWLSAIERYAFPYFGTRPIETIGTSDILSALSPIWAEKNDTAKRVKQRLTAIFDWAKGAGHYPHENPVNGLLKALPAVKTRVVHMPSLPWQSLPAFMSALSERKGLSARTLELLILTATRSGEARGARWSEFQGAEWVIPAERMKSGRPHRIPLSDEALAVLDKVRGLDEDLLFPSQKRNPDGTSRVQSDVVFKALMKRMNIEGITTHGFRSTFRDWCGESVRADREVAEAALAHSFGSKVERAYARSDLFERRRTLMNSWGQYATGKAGKVVQMVRA
jgi:integrase